MVAVAVVMLLVAVAVILLLLLLTLLSLIGFVEQQKQAPPFQPAASDGLAQLLGGAEEVVDLGLARVLAV